MQMVKQVSSRCAWVLDDTGFPKKGTSSVGVARQYSGTLGKVGNSQIGVSLNYATDEGCFPLDFELYLPEAWIADKMRREKTGVPVNATFKRKWEQGLEMNDRARVWGVPQGVIVVDAGYGSITEFRRLLAARDLSYRVGISRDDGMWRSEVKSVPYQGFGRSRKAMSACAVPAPQRGRQGHAQAGRMPQTETATAIARSLRGNSGSTLSRLR